jgi:outer membrane protein OmpA-like peptidoglycan-associated protein
MWPDGGARPWLQLDAGLGFTGALLRPVVRVSAGVDFQLSSSLSLGPLLGYSQLFQHDLPGASTDARFVWFGFALGLGPAQTVTRVRVQEKVQERVITRTREVQPEPEPPPAPPPAAEVPVAAPSPELNALLETALPSQRQEWLAPVLFSLDSAELEAQGVAMLHEVANELTRRTEIHAVEIRGYADARGDVEHNLQLSERRAQTVRAWLIAHGIASERLRVAPHGAADFVESGSSEPEHAQNRRVVFRVVEQGDAP